MNRRGLMKFLGIGAAAAAVSTTGILAKSLPSGKIDDGMWIKEQCEYRIGSDGGYLSKPRDTEVEFAEKDVEYVLCSNFSSDLLEEYKTVLASAREKYSADMLQWSSSALCGVEFKRLRGVTTRCPSCGGQASGGEDRGIWLCLTTN